ncbi:MAG: peptidoglycan-binding protein [Deltaproteobacteria bacterium]|nr:peptidoglycan-binding protein [Deltaproteobacteria bacterium]
MLKKGSKGQDVTKLQQQLGQLGFALTPDGAFGGQTDEAVRKLQTMFGYTVDGIVGPGTQKLIDAQIGYGWNVNAPDAAKRATDSQKK